MGAVVKVDPTSGAFSVMHKFEYPPAIFGCPLLYDPSVTHTDEGAKTRVLMDFTSSFGLLVEIGIASGSVLFHTAPQDPFFAGFVNFEFAAGASGGRGQALGLAPTVTEGGVCSDGCFEWGDLAVPSGKFSRRAIVPFKAILDDAHFDDGKGSFFVQGSYDLRGAAERCGGANNATECLLRIDKASGALESSTPTPSWTAYKFSDARDSSGKVSAWVNGFDAECRDPYNDWAFGWIDLDTAQATLRACISHNVTVHMDEWIGSFSPDHSMFATASGDSEAPAQLLVFDVAAGTTVLQSSLAGLAKELDAFENMFEVWDVAII
jgi:hypothetical protein